MPLSTDAQTALDRVSELVAEIPMMRASTDAVLARLTGDPLEDDEYPIVQPDEPHGFTVEEPEDDVCGTCGRHRDAWQHGGTPYEGDPRPLLIEAIRAELAEGESGGVTAEDVLDALTWRHLRPALRALLDLYDANEDA